MNYCVPTYDDIASGNQSQCPRANGNSVDQSYIAKFCFLATQPPQCKEFADTVTQWCIYDSYLKDIHAAEAAKNTNKEKKSATLELDAKKKPSESDPIYSDAMKLSTFLYRGISS